MRASARAGLERDPAGSRRATLLELFFDLVFVVALAQISRNLGLNVSWLGIAQAVLLLAAIWWVWAITAFVTDLYDPQQVWIQFLMIAVMLGALVMAATVPHAFGHGGLVFAGAYVGIHLGRGLLLVPILRGRRAQGRAVRIFCWFTVSTVPWIVGALLPADTLRLAVWALAAAIDYLGFFLGYPVPGRRRLPPEQFSVTAAHLAERYQQFFMIALGDAILVAGLVYSEAPAGIAPAGGLFATFLSTVLLWRVYTHRAGEVLPQAIESAPAARRFIGMAPYTHLLMVAGVVFAAAAFKQVITEPLETVGWRTTALLLGGPVLFLLGRIRFDYEVFARGSGSRLVALGLLVAIVPLTRLLPLVGIAGYVCLVLAGVAAADTLRDRGRRAEPSASAT
ncbi:low temperature requirement protein A [Micromonospora sp. WMMD1102]|uniref:low temperature requirement protein A n=1 Tax=Micromonospora sp. WMMD1102 TaxID=3016105 RepID=UPI0024151580|nr:low temperature requirement protein A [Micromonospora sp. WMMD1102]MDG4787251.1 low temperature requirement protein A [Micromonospora sp. WMMD1102]